LQEAIDTITPGGKLVFYVSPASWPRGSLKVWAAARAGTLWGHGCLSFPATAMTPRAIDGHNRPPC